MSPNKNEPESKVALIKQEINKELGDADTFKSLIAATFTFQGKAMAPELVKRAILDGMIRGFSIEDFFKKNVYAIPFGDTYSLVTSIDHARKIAQRSGIIGSARQEWELDDHRKPITCTVTVQKKVGDTIGDFAATVFFDEFTTGKNLWATKPRHMLGKVAEMHALRKAFPEELAQSYVEEEMQRAEVIRVSEPTDPRLIEQWETMLRDCKDMEQFERICADVPGDLRAALKSVMEDMKAILLTEGKDIK